MSKWVLIGLCLNLSGCTIPLTCSVYNNTGYELLGEIIKEGVAIEKFNVKQESQVEIKSWEYKSYRINYGDITSKFEPPLINQNFVRYSGFGPWGKRTLSVQIERDGRIFLLKVGQNTPAEYFPDQPEGFPIKPKEEEVFDL